MGLFLLLLVLTPEQWSEDVATLTRELAVRHKNAFSRISRSDFERESAALRERIPNLKEHEIRAGVQRLVASVGDAHTTVDMPWRSLPLRLMPFAEGLHVVAASEEYRALVGGRVEKVGGVAVDEAARRLAEYVSHENESWLKIQLRPVWAQPELLHAAGLSDSPEHAVYEVRTADGSLVSADVSLSEETPALVRAFTAVPMWQQRIREPYWAKILEDGKTLYIQYNRCQDDPKLPMAQFRREWNKLAATKGVVRVVVDVRGNGGGDSRLFEPSLKDLERSRFNRKGKLFVLIGPGTFSSGLLTAWLMRENTVATLVGEPTGGKPNAYGEVRTFELPNSKLLVRYSTKRFEIQKKDTPSLMPDRTVALSFSDMAAGRDAVLESVLR